MDKKQIFLLVCRILDALAVVLVFWYLSSIGIVWWLESMGRLLGIEIDERSLLIRYCRDVINLCDVIISYFSRAILALLKYALLYSLPLALMGVGVFGAKLLFSFVNNKNE